MQLGSDRGARLLPPAGTAWLDMLEMTQLNDCPAASDGSAAFFDLTPPPFDTSLPTAKALNANSSGCCQAGWMAGVNFQKVCEGQAGWFWWYPNAGPVSVAYLLALCRLAVANHKDLAPVPVLQEGGGMNCPLLTLEVPQGTPTLSRTFASRAGVA